MPSRRLLLLPCGRRSGNRRCPKSAINTKPTANIVKPTGVKLKKLNGSSPRDTNSLLTATLGGVPMSVCIPPKSDPNDSGMSNLLGLMPASRAKLRATGNITATVPVELINADKNALASINNSIKRVGLLPALLLKKRPTRSATPVSNSPAPTTNKPAIMMTNELEKPASASLADSTPVMVSASSDNSATKSSRMRSLINKPIVIAKITKTTIIGVFKIPPYRSRASIASIASVITYARAAVHGWLS